MTSYQETFKRKEIKYCINASQYARIREGLAGHMQIDEYGASGIDSLYYDTPSRSIIERSLEKPYYKEKLRVRRYRANAELAYVELKKKVNGIVYKRRVQMPMKAAMAYMRGASYVDSMSKFADAENPTMAIDAAKLQISRELDEFKKRYPGLRKSMIVSVTRTAWKPVEGVADSQNLRITFDEDAMYKDMMAGTPGYNQVAPSQGRITPADTAIMEIKCLGAYPLWLVGLLNEVGAYPTSFSKYGEAYKICTGAREAVVEPLDCVRAIA